MKTSNVKLVYSNIYTVLKLQWKLFQHATHLVCSMLLKTEMQNADLDPVAPMPVKVNGHLNPR